MVESKVLSAVAMECEYWVLEWRGDAILHGRKGARDRDVAAQGAVGCGHEGECCLWEWRGDAVCKEEREPETQAVKSKVLLAVAFDWDLFFTHAQGCISFFLSFSLSLLWLWPWRVSVGRKV